MVGGCAGIDTGGALPTTGADAAVTAPDDFDLEMMQIATRYKSFSKIDNTAYASSLGVGNINLYVWGDSKDYKLVSPETTGSGITMVVGSVIVREVLDSSGAVDKLTLMAKGPAGYDPTLGDWWFGVLDASGTPAVTDGRIQLGRLGDCHSCHIPRETDDYLFGVPQADQHH